MDIKNNNMNNLDLSKLRFRIGDTVLYQGFECKVLAYYAYEGSIGYTIDVRSICEESHDGTMYSVDENGNSVDPKCDTCLYMADGWIEPINK